MARTVENWKGLTFQTGREYTLVYGRKGWTGSVMPFAVPDQQDFAEAIAATPGLTLQGVGRPAFSEDMKAHVIYRGPGLETPGELLVLPLQVEADVAGSVTLELEEIVVRGQASPQEQDQADDREETVVEDPGSGPLGMLKGLPWPLLAAIALVLFAFTGAGQKALEEGMDAIGGGG